MNSQLKNALPQNKQTPENFNFECKPNRYGYRGDGFTSPQISLKTLSKTQVFPILNYWFGFLTNSKEKGSYYKEKLPSLGGNMQKKEECSLRSSWQPSGHYEGEHAWDQTSAEDGEKPAERSGVLGTLLEPISSPHLKLAPSLNCSVMRASKWPLSFKLKKKNWLKLYLSDEAFHALCSLKYGVAMYVLKYKPKNAS